MHHYLVKLYAHWKLHGPVGVSSAVGAAALDKLGTSIAGSTWFEDILGQRFDRRFGVETSQGQPIVELDLPESVAPHAVGYEATQSVELFQILDSLPIRKDATFVDIGCGKGRALLIASMFPFGKLEGVELSKSLSETCRHNLSVPRPLHRVPPWTITNVNAKDYRFPETDLVIFMFNPFDRSIMRPMLENLRSSLERRPRQVTVLYSNARERDCFESMDCWRARQVDFPLKDWWACYNYAPRPTSREAIVAERRGDQTASGVSGQQHAVASIDE